MGCSPWGRQESDMTERFHFHFSLSCIEEGNVLGASVRNPTRDKVMWQRPDGQGESSLRFSPWYFLSMYPQNKNLPALYFSTLLTHSGKS